eukprot:Cvel_26024.t1-p1 / transcript=Cvel_26024.t1 / gene=Cvel_26024 / organism=Chromera_velia_CCMP2878 / gene_product=Adenylate cyclase type 10, putative / transcript_product=Adenylate cyclase type 10, putative / location=Cvel_scaffold3031:619-7739(-) / protein_length=677 / sequence_SO=supercontig / SO=protein_coding / is_pseudo=false
MGNTESCVNRGGNKRREESRQRRQQLLQQQRENAEKKRQLAKNEDEDNEVYEKGWQLMACCTERRFKRDIAGGMDEGVVDPKCIESVACFVPGVIRDAIISGKIKQACGPNDVVVKRCQAAVVFADASGFTAMTEKLSKQPNGAEMLSNCINSFFAKILDEVKRYGGDIIKFSGDAITIVFAADAEGDIDGDLDGGAQEDDDDDEDEDSDSADEVADHFFAFTGAKRQSRGALLKQRKRGRSVKGNGLSLRQAVHYALQCCVDVHSSVEKFTVGGELDRYEYVVAGPPLGQVSIAEPLASSGETVVSPEVYEYAKDFFVEGNAVPSPHEAFKQLKDVSKRLPEPKQDKNRWIMEGEDVKLLKRYIPLAIYGRLKAGYELFIEEMRTVSVIFCCVQGVDVSTAEGCQTAQKIMTRVQRSVYSQEGSVNKFLVDDKGVLILAVFGLPPLHHVDDAARAVQSGHRIFDNLRVLGLDGLVGVTTGRVWCGVVGSPFRKEYTVLGDTVNLSARLMGNAAKYAKEELKLLVCETTYKACKHRIEFEALEPIKVKGKAQAVPVYRPTASVNDRSTKLDKQLLVSGGVLALHSAQPDGRVEIGYLAHKMAEEKGFNVVQGCNKFDFKSDFVENVFENLPQLAWFQIFTGLLEHAKRADRRIWGHQRTTTEILTDYLPDNMKPALH